MSVDVIMPQMGESIAEGTIVKWLKQVGDKVDRDEPLFEISTDKVDAEIPSPAAGTLLEVMVTEGTTVEINTIVGRIGAEGEAATKSSSAAPAPAADKPQPAAPSAAPASAPAATATATQSRAVRSSPVVQKIAAEHNVDISLIDGTGEGGRITKKDVLGYSDSAQSAGPVIASAPSAAAPSAPAPAATPPRAASAPAAARSQVFASGQDEVREPMSVMRKKIAEHMVMSKQTSPHVYTIFEVDMHHVVQRRETMKKEFAGEGVKLTFLPFFIEACIRGIKEYPIINSSVDGDTPPLGV
jgi:2-oxoglutarate dehydrogenase E2 component (dihydrolipoamide succinyltransferase)